ncbi:MAG: hypothetical protein CFE30_35410 [Bradyrhizobium sp. PARBB1]|nr:MAG: hypothetical protein CFE30_35410 [Bradyrhizobium sp. PARBB1]
MMRGAILLVLAAQEAAPPPRVPEIRMVPAAPMERHPRPARAERLKTVDIPQEAKDAGHNGTAAYTATVGADGKLVALALKQSSMSPAIDASVEAKARALYYFPATDADGKTIQGTVDVVASYARHDKDSPGGGIESYTCGELVREYDWFTGANAGRRKLFWPENAYTSLASIEAMRQSLQQTREERLASRQAREKMWAKLIKRCRKAPDKLMLDEVDQPVAYANLVNSF